MSATSKAGRLILVYGVGGIAERAPGSGADSIQRRGYGLQVLFREMQVARGGCQIVMAQQHLKRLQMYASFELVGGVAVAEDVRGNGFR